ncbi:hypothetical protein GPX89_04205 [Nocardia sp. ET3-3]|uniref:Secreted protein n=1 Tax=Nocardia terrae TaxID=2675851 RepID=A0A7K1UQ32_9NOCA|nr:hypothetical protein [Nocardia terrae]MVU76445.1 hypothetical protein [Nocardia terrae]
MTSIPLRRITARVAAAGAIALIPLAAVTIPASADVPLQPSPGDVAWPHHGDGGWDNDDWHHRHDRDRDDWNHDRDDWNHDRDDWDHDGWNGDWNRGNCCWRQVLPPTGSW